MTTDNPIEKLIEQNDELENYFRNTIIPQLFVDANLTLRKFTPPAMKQFKLAPSDVGRSIIDVKDNFRFPSIIENIQHVIDNNDILEKEIQTTDLRWYQMNIIPYVSFQTKTTNGVIITFVEITERIKDLKEQERLIAEHETLLDTISHDIRTPLTSLVVAIDLFETVSQDDTKRYQALVKMLSGSIRKMQSIIEDLTDTRKQKHKYIAEDELLNLEHILEDVRLTLNDKIEESGARIKTDIAISEITFSRRKLRSIIYNLISNAIKFKAPDGKPEIIIRSFSEDKFTVISVKDNGIGIEPKSQEAIFSKYFRVANAIEGSGIGLYLVKEIVNNTGGRIELESEKGRGSEFKVYLPA